MNSIKHLLFFYGALFLLVIIVQSCCNYHARIVGNGEFIVSQIGDRNDTDTITGPFYIKIIPEREFLTNVASGNLMASAYATSCHYTYENNFDYSTIKLTCNREIETENGMISASDNFIDSIGIKPNITEYSDILDITVQISDDFMDGAVFKNEYYIFKLALMTDDSLLIEGSKTVFMEL